MARLEVARLVKMGPSPHIRTKETVEDVMYDVVIALLPALIVATYVFGLRAITVTAVAVLSCMGTEWIFQKAMKQDISIYCQDVPTGKKYLFEDLISQ